MASLFEDAADFRTDPAFQSQRSSQVRMRSERVREVLRLEPGRLDGLLRVHAKHRNVQENLEHRLRLSIAAGRTERHQQFAVFEGHRRVGCQAGPFPRLER